MLNFNEFSEFLETRCQAVGQVYDHEVAQNIFNEMNVNNDEGVDKKEFLDFMIKVFKDCEDNIEFLHSDIKLMNEKIKEIN